MPLPEKMRVLIVDDEEPARQRLRDHLSRHPHVGSLSEASNGKMAISMIIDEEPDVVLLDVQMPEVSGLQVIQAVGSQHMPLTVFVTAYDQHAIKAFEANALDFLLKPYSDERLEAMIARVMGRLEEAQLRAFGELAMRAVSALGPQGEYIDRLALRTGDLTRFLRVADIDWIEAAGVYVNLYVEGKAVLHRISLGVLAESLDPRKFVRIHRSAIVNIDSIMHLEQLSHGEFDVLLRNGSRTRVSRTYRGGLERTLRQEL